MTAVTTAKMTQREVVQALPAQELGVVAVLFVKEKPLHTLSGDERRAQEEREGAEQ
jgi:hypothetical protein